MSTPLLTLLPGGNAGPGAAPGPAPAGAVSGDAAAEFAAMLDGVTAVKGDAPSAPLTHLDLPECPGLADGPELPSCPPLTHPGAATGPAQAVVETPAVAPSGEIDPPLVGEEVDEPPASKEPHAGSARSHPRTKSVAVGPLPGKLDAAGDAEAESLIAPASALAELVVTTQPTIQQPSTGEAAGRASDTPAPSIAAVTVASGRPEGSGRPANPTPVEYAPVQQIVAQPTPAEPTRGHPAPAQPAPAQPIPSQPTPAQSTPAQSTPVPTQPAPVHATSAPTTAAAVAPANPPDMVRPHTSAPGEHASEPTPAAPASAAFIAPAPDAAPAAKAAPAAADTAPSRSEPTEPTAPSAAPTALAFLPTTPPTTVTAPPTTSTSTPGVAQPELHKALATTVHAATTRQHRDGTQVMQVALHPAELGAVHVRATLRHGSLHVTVACADEAARAAVEAALPEMHRQLTAIASFDLRVDGAALGGASTDAGGGGSASQSGGTQGRDASPREGGRDQPDTSSNRNREQRSANSRGLDRWI